MAYESDYRPIDTLISNTSDNGTYTSDYTPVTPGLTPEQQGALDRNMEIVKQAVPQAMEAASVRRRPPVKTGTNWEVFKGGLKEGLSGLATRKYLLGEKYNPADVIAPQGFGQEVLQTLGGVASDLPGYIVAGLPGALTGPVGGRMLMPTLAMGGTEAAKSYLRGESLKEIATHGGKGALTGAAMGGMSLLGLPAPLARRYIPSVAGKWVQKATLPMEIAGASAVGAGLEGQPLKAKDIALMSLPVGVLHGTGAGTRKAVDYISRRRANPVAERMLSEAEALPQDTPEQAAIRAERIRAAENMRIPQTRSYTPPTAGAIFTNKSNAEPEPTLITINPEDTKKTKGRKSIPTGMEGLPFGEVISDSLKAEREAAKVKAKEDRIAERRRIKEEKAAAKQKTIVDKEKAKQETSTQEAIDEAQKIVEAVESPTPENVEQKPLSRRAAKAAEKEEAAELRAIYENELKGYNLTPEGFAESMNDFDNLPIQAKRGRVESLYTPDPATAPTPEEVAKAQEMWNIAQEAGRKQQEKMADIELLKEAGYSERQIADMTEDSLANAIRKVKRRDTTSLVTDEEMETLSGFEQVISDAIERAVNGEVIPEGELIEIMKMSQAINVHPIDVIAGRPMPGKIITYEQLKRTREGLRAAAKRKEQALQQVQAEATNLQKTAPSKVIRRRGGVTTEVVKTAKETENLGAKRRQRQKDTVENEREAALKKMIEEQEADRRAQEEGGTGLEEESIEDLRRREESGEGQGYGAYNWEDRSQTMTPEQRLARKAQDLATYAKNLREGGLPNEDFYKVQIAANKMMREYADKVVRGEAMTPAEIRTYAVAIYKVIPQNAADMAFLRRAYQTIEADLAKIPGHVDSFKLADVSEADKTLQIHGDETRMVNSVLRALRSDPTFKFEVNRLTGIDPRAERTVLGSYNFAQNLVKLHDPTSMAHEVVHWSFWNVLTPRERAAYMDYYFKTFFDEQGRPKFDEMVNATSNALDALGGPTEMFATLGHDYYANRVMSMTERSLFQRVKDWWNNFIANPELKALKPRFDEVSKLFDRVWMKDTRITRTGGARMIDTIPASERAIMVNGELKRAGEFVKEVTTPPRREPTDIRNSVTLDMLGLQSMYERAAEIWKNARRYHQIKGSQIAAEVKGPDGKERVVTVMRNPKDERSIPLFKQWLYTQPALFEGTPVEPYWFRLNAHDLYWQFNHDQNRMHLHNAYRMLGNDQERINSIRGVLEGKNKNPDPELAQASLEVKQWLEGMKGRVKNHLMDSYKKQLHGDEYNALLDLIAGKDIIDVTKKYPKVDGPTLLEINKNYNKIDKWGIDDYVPNYEFGHMKIMMKDPESGQMKIVAIGLSEKDAIRKSVKYLNEHPDYAGNLFVDTSASQFFDKTGVSAKHYYSMLGAFERSMKKSIENIDAGVRKKIARKVVSQKYIIEPTHKYSPYLEERRGRLQGEEDLQKLLNHYSYSIEKKLALDPIIDDIRTAISFNKFDKSQVAAITDLISDVKGKYWVSDQIVDGLLKWGGQKVAGITGLDFGIDPHGSFSKITKRGRQFEANVKLGYRPAAAFVNLASGQMHTWTKVGTKYYTEAAKFLLTPEGRAFIEKVEPYLGVSLAEEMSGKVHTKESLLKPLGLFQRPEFLNRKVATAAMYLMEKASGASELAATEAAIRANWMTQFTYNMASLPKIMRGPTGKMVFQFMPYLANEIRFMANLSPFEWFKYLSWQTALSGPRGLILTAKTLPLLAVCGWYQDMMDDAESWMNTHTPNLFRGAMGAVSKAFGPEWAPDISGPASMQFPGGMGGKFGGPLIQDMIVLFSDFMKGMPLALNEDRQLETTPAALDWRTGTGKIVPAFRHWAGIWDYFIDKNHHVLDTRYNNLYSLPDLPNPEAAGHIANKLFAADSIRESAEKTMERIEYRKRSKEKMRKAELGNKIQYDIMREGKISDNSMRKASELGVDPSRAVEEGMIQSAVPMYRRRQVGEDIRQFIRRQESEPEFIGEED